MGLSPQAKGEEHSAASHSLSAASKGGQYRYHHFIDEEYRKLRRAHLEPVAILGSNPLHHFISVSFYPFRLILSPTEHSEASNCTVQIIPIQ